MKPFAVAVLFGSTLAIAAAYGSAFLPGGAPAWAAWVLAIGMSACMVGMMVLGAARDGKLGRLKIPFALVFLILVVGFGIALALPGTDPVDPELWLGLPPRAAVVLFGIGFLPLLVAPVAYALTFEEQTLRPGDLERVRRHRTAADPAAAAERSVAPPAVVEAGR
jgi:hypothetical protein